MASDEQPKIIVDTDWKSQAQAEKERLAQKSAASKPAAKPAAGESQQSGIPGGPPGPGDKVGLPDLISLLVTQALSYLGAFPDPKTGQAMVSLELAKVYIDMLGVLQDKTKGNLSEEEDQLLSRTVSELRLEFVEISKVVEKAVAEGKVRKVGAGGGQGGPGISGPGMSGPGMAGPGMSGPGMSGFSAP